MQIFFDESGSTEPIAVLVLVECSDFVMDYINKNFTKPKEPPPALEAVFQQTDGEFKFSDFLNAYHRTQRKEVKDYLVRKLGQLSALNLKVYYSVYENVEGQARQASEAAWLLHTFAGANYDDLLSKQVRLVADKGFYRSSDLTLRLWRVHERRGVVVARKAFHVPSAYQVRKEIPIEVWSSKVQKGLQAADFIAGAIRQKEAKDNPEFYDVIRERIKFKRSTVGKEYDWFPTGPRANINLGKAGKFYGKK